jgi:hypothetical protein
MAEDGNRDHRLALRPVSGGSLREADRDDLCPAEPTALFVRCAITAFAM